MVISTPSNNNNKNNVYIGGRHITVDRLRAPSYFNLTHIYVF